MALHGGGGEAAPCVRGSKLTTYHIAHLRDRTLITSNDVRIDISGNEPERVTELILTALRVNDWRKEHLEKWKGL